MNKRNIKKVTDIYVFLTNYITTKQKKKDFELLNSFEKKLVNHIERNDSTSFELKELLNDIKEKQLKFFYREFLLQDMIISDKDKPSLENMFEKMLNSNGGLKHLKNWLIYELSLNFHVEKEKGEGQKVEYNKLVEFIENDLKNVSLHKVELDLFGEKEKNLRNNIATWLKFSNQFVDNPSIYLLFDHNKIIQQIYEIELSSKDL